MDETSFDSNGPLIANTSEFAFSPSLTDVPADSFLGFREQRRVFDELTGNWRWAPKFRAFSSAANKGRQSLTCWFIMFQIFSESAL